MTESDVAVVVERLENLKKDVKDGQERAEKWREHFDAKLDSRPCISHAKFISSVSIQLKGIWFLIGILLTATIMEFLKK